VHSDDSNKWCTISLNRLIESVEGATRRMRAAEEGRHDFLKLVAACCSVLQCVAVCCSVLQCVAVCCSVLQCVAVCCMNDASHKSHSLIPLFLASCCVLG